MADYIKLGHMRKISSNEIGRGGSYFMPHHGVMQQSHGGPKLRVVFDASSKSSTGYSLNDVMRKGPVVQSSLYSILLRFRVHQFVITTDVEKMYRQIQVAEEDAKWQRIVWRDDCTSQVDYYQLVTVTYGTTSAPYLATRTLKEIAMISRAHYPKAANITERDTYVDDIMTGCKTESELVEIRDNLVKIFSESKMNLRKWISNSPTVLDGLSQPDVDICLKSIEDSAENVKVSGLQWDPVHDKFVFKVRLDEPGKVTKRNILSEISRVFDPLGLVSPCIVQVKILLQLLWKAKVEWDEELPMTFKHQWINMRDQLRTIEGIKIPRWIHTTTHAEIHGFCDASSLAYGACIYVKVNNCEGSDRVSLYTSKSKVAPTNPLTIPRLELCAAVLLSRLMKEVQDEIGVEIKSIRNYWNHVAGNENPADLASRGATPTQLKQSNLWWHGPQWLHSATDNWSIQPFIPSENGEKAVKCLVAISDSNDVIVQLEERISSFFKIVKVLAAVFKYFEVIRTPKHLRNPTITSIDVIRAELEIFKKVQGEFFTIEIKDLSMGREISKSSRLLCLNPFIDVHGVLRVGGRLSRAAVDYNIKHPIILPSKSLLVRKMIEEGHVKYRHAGATLLLSILKQRFLIVGARRLVRHVVRKCVQCFKCKPRSEEQQMADLPTARVQFVRPFLKVGVDYAGPFSITPIRRRGQRSMKNYVCIFICLATRAIHIELVFNLTTEDFLAALKRMTSRRGLCSDIYSDCGSNFVGANKELCHLYKFLCSNNNDLRTYLLKDKINWHFNPPGAPHFGGIWEAAVKAMKVHLRRVLGNTIPTIDEFNTLLVEIEGLLNSRPLCRSTTEDIDCLTPAHFLIGHPLTTIPDANLCEDRAISYEKRWKMIQQLSQNFWTRWHREYLVTLQERTKWNRRKPNLVIGDIVIIKDDSLVAKRWVLGKVIELYEGEFGEVKRPVQKLCKLPIGEPEDSRGAGCLR